MIKPAVDPQYWFDFSKTLIDDAVKRRDEAAERLQRLVLWLWGVYTTATTIGFSLAEKGFSIGLTLLVGSTSLALISVYWITVWVRTPRIVAFDPRSPDDIKAAYQDLLNAKQWRLNLGLGVSVIAALLVATSLILVSIPRDSEAMVLPIVAAKVEGIGDKKSVAVSTVLEPGIDVKVFLFQEDESLARGNMVTNEKGRFHVSLPLVTNDVDVKGLQVSLSWTSAGKRTVTLAVPVAAE